MAVRIKPLITRSSGTHLQKFCIKCYVLKAMEYQIDDKKTSTGEQIKEDLNPVIDYSECPSQFAGARYIIECGIKLKANLLTVATAATYFHRFFNSISLKEYDPYLIGCTCLYLASKVEDDDIKIRDIINVGINCVRPESPPLPLEPYFALRDSLIQAELLLMRVLGFKLKVDLPHKYLLHYVESLKEWLGEKKFNSIPFVDLSFTLLQDIYHSPIVIKYSPQLLSAAILNIVNQVYGVVVPGCDDLHDQSWFTGLHTDCTTKAVWEVSSEILAMYKEEEKLKIKNKK